MGRTINTESKTAESRFVSEFEYSATVLEYWDQFEPPGRKPLTESDCSSAESCRALFEPYSR